ncbi:MAG TPA: hypothetical protein VH207_15580 [Chthoniobacterales bacterium]|jgi:hypothetical protein|nr:hypothetical protein [Chthoniobacterales bacterium]
MANEKDEENVQRLTPNVERSNKSSVSRRLSLAACRAAFPSLNVERWRLDVFTLSAPRFLIFAKDAFPVRAVAQGSPMNVSAVVSLLFLTLVPAMAITAVREPRVTVEMRNLGRPENAPLPAYPKEARLHSWGGLAIYEIHCKFDGTVSFVFVRLLTGHSILDEAGKAALAQWRWHGGRFRLFTVFMTFDPGTPLARSSPARSPD